MNDKRWYITHKLLIWCILFIYVSFYGVYKHILEGNVYFFILFNLAEIVGSTSPSTYVIGWCTISRHFSLRSYQPTQGKECVGTCSL